MKRLMALIPCQKTIACNTHMMAKQIQPRCDRPRNAPVVSEESDGQNFSATSIRALAAR